MSSNGFIQLSQDYYRVEQAIQYLEDNFRRQPSLKEIAESVHLSEYHFQRIFTRWAGISPKRFLQFLTLKYAKQLLAESQNLLDVTYEAGLSSPGRLHDLFVTYEAVTPGEYKSQGEGLEIIYGFHPCPFGECLLAVTERGICGLAFVPEDRRRQALDRLKANWPQASFDENSVYTQPFVERIFNPAIRQNGGEPLKLYLKGTNFQLKVWQALLQIPAGTVVSYDTVAALIGQPAASRAVGQAAAHNAIGFVIPCHRVIRKAGGIGEYAWDSTRKKAIIGWEAAQRYRDTVQDTTTDEKQPFTTA